MSDINERLGWSGRGISPTILFLPMRWEGHGSLGGEAEKKEAPT